MTASGKSDAVLAVDIGSTWCKAAFLDPQGRVLAQGRAPTRHIPTHRHKTLDGFWQAFVQSVQAAHCHLPAHIRPAALGIACRALFGACLDADGQGFWPSWDVQLDRRATPEIRHAYGPELWGARNPFAHGYAPAFGGLLGWLRRHRRQEWRAIRRAGALRDFLVYRMTGQWLTDPATGPNRYAWPPEVLELSGLPASALPSIRNPQEVAGPLTRQASRLLGLAQGTPVVVGQHDGAAANLGVGAIRPGDGCFTFGTNFVFRGVTGAGLASHSMGYWVAPGVWSWVGNIPGAAAQLETATGLLDPDEPDVSGLHARLSALAAGVAAGAGGLGLRVAPPGQEEQLGQAVDAARRAGHSPAVVYRALLEAVALAERGLVARAVGDGVQPRRFVATGGGAHNRLFLQILASVLGAPVEMGAADGGVWGAGMAAAVGAGWYNSLGEALAEMATPGRLIEPDPEAAAVYARL